MLAALAPGARPPVSLHRRESHRTVPHLRHGRRYHSGSRFAQAAAASARIGAREGGGRAVAIALDLVRTLTDEELRTLSEHNPGYQLERSARGELMVSPTGAESGRRSAEVLFQLQMWNRRSGSGVVFDSSTGFHLPDGSCLSPDASWIQHDRWRAVPWEARLGFAPLCPDVVFEVRSPSDRADKLRGKMVSYLTNGARLGVLLDPEGRVTEVYRPGRAPEVHTGTGGISLDPELPGLTLDPGPVFED